MHLWILTIGSSDVQLDSNSQSQEKSRSSKDFSDKIWNYWYTDELKAEYNLPGSAVPTRSFIDKDETYRVAPRILGIIYQASFESVQKEIWSYLTFPLLDNFVKDLEDENAKNPKDYPLPEAIVILLTDQSAIFKDDRQRKLKSPYWQDTCELKPILQHYFQDRFSNIPCEFMVLTPETQEQSLDNWNAVLDLVRDQFCVLKICNQPVELALGETVYVSHQAGTPAISSAVQFCSLAKFGRRVRFLVSNEQNADLTDVVASSTYLRGIEIQQAKKLLARYDYSGIKEVLQKQIEEANKPKDEPKLEDEVLKHVSYLLDIAIQWNFAKFDDFAKALINYPDQSLVKLAQAHLENIELAQSYLSNAELAKTYLEDPDQYWWWEAYEAAYLGVVRLKQKNVVEAMFHSFRAFEGLAIKDAERHNISGKFGRKAFKSLRHRKQAEWNHHPYIRMLIDLDSSDDQRNDLLDKRNGLFHQLRGFQPGDLFDAWGADEMTWQERALGCLNFISDETFEFLDKESSDGRFASLMVKVHQELENAIDHL